MVVARGWVALCFEERLEIGGLLGGRLQRQSHVRDACEGVERTLVVRRERAGIAIAF